MGAVDYPDDPARESRLSMPLEPRDHVMDLLAFGWHNAVSCGFAGFIFFFMGASHHFTVPHLARYDMLLLLCLAWQVAVVALKVETVNELKVVCIFHGLGLAMEVLKVHYGSWSYPGDGLLKIGGVPLFSGFMYASVASYICQAWRRLNLTMVRWPRRVVAVPLAAAVYGNFMTNQFLPDARALLFPAILLAYRRTWVEYTPRRGHRRYRMPMVFAFFFIAVFIFFAENIGTFLGAWRYPNQHYGWEPVYFQKLSSWTLLVIVSVMIVAELQRYMLLRTGATDETRIGAGED